MEQTTSNVRQRPREQVGVLAATAMITLAWCASLTPVKLCQIALSDAFEMEGFSAAPGVYPFERFAVNRARYGLFIPFASQPILSWGMPDLGEVVILKSPVDDRTVVKRVIGVPGDVIETRGFTVTRNKRDLAHADAACPAQLPASAHTRRCFREWLASRSYTTTYDSEPGASEATQVPSGFVYVLSDCRTRFNDSRNRSFGLVPRKRLLGAPTRIYASPYPDRVMSLVN